MDMNKKQKYIEIVNDRFTDRSKELILKQIDLFKSGVEEIKKYFKNIKYIHSSASSGLINYDDNISNAVRPGIILYGLESYKGLNKMINIKPVSTLKSRIIFLKDIDKKESVGYSRRFRSTKKMKIATIPIGYADGLRRELSNKGYVVIHGKKAKIIGSICMDSTMIDITNIDNVKLEDEVYIWDNENIKLEDISNICNTINYEILCGISTRVKRIFKNED